MFGVWRLGHGKPRLGLARDFPRFSRSNQKENRLSADALQPGARDSNGDSASYRPNPLLPRQGPETQGGCDEVAARDGKTRVNCRVEKPELQRRLGNRAKTTPGS